MQVGLPLLSLAVRNVLVQRQFCAIYPPSSFSRAYFISPINKKVKFGVDISCLTIASTAFWTSPDAGAMCGVGARTASSRGRQDRCEFDPIENYLPDE